MSENHPGAGGKGTAGYFGYSTDEAKDEAFERRYREQIPKGIYGSRAHNEETCTKCTKLEKTLHYCNQHGFGLGRLPVTKEKIGSFTVVTCEYCKRGLNGKQVNQYKTRK